MTYTAALPPAHHPLELDLFLERSHKGLFSAPWLERPDPLEIAAVQRQARTLSAHALASPSDWTPAMSHLLDVRSHCLLAAAALDPIPARHHYNEALKACREALDLLHHATEGTEGALATWALGVHTLILAQLAMPDLKESERLAREAIVILSRTHDPVCSGAEADAHSATLLAQEPQELHRRLADLPDQVSDKIEYYRYEIDRQERHLNDLLAGVTTAHATAFRAVTLWVLLNLALMATLPLNGWLAPQVPWSLPFVVAVPVLWYLTWDRPFRGDLRFFDWLRWLRATSLVAFKDGIRDLIHPVAQFRESTTLLLRKARADRERLAAFHLFILPSAADTVDKVAELADDGKAILAGEWMLELKDSIPWSLEEALPIEPSMLPNGTRIYYDRPV